MRKVENAVRESERRRLREKIESSLRWIKSALAEIESSADSDYQYAGDVARGAHQHLSDIASAAGELRVRNET